MAFLRYTLLRALLLGVTLAVLYLVGLHSILPLFIVAIFLSGLISLVVLSRTRDQVSASVDKRVRRINERIEANNRAEDVDPPQAPYQAP